MFTNLLDKPAAPLTLPHEPLVIGFIFREHKGHYYNAFKCCNTPNKQDAWVYLADEIELCMKKSLSPLWGKRSQGHWIAVYANLPAMHCNS